MAIHFNDNNWEELVVESQIPVFVDFWAEWCGPCINLIGPMFEQLSPLYEGKVKMGKLNVDENPAVATRYGVRNLPTVLVFKDGLVVDKIVGAFPQSQMVQKIHQQIQS